MSFDRCAAGRLPLICCAIACVAIVSALLAAPAQAAFPGRNGRIAFEHFGGLNEGGIFADSGVFSVWPGGSGARRLLDRLWRTPRTAVLPERAPHHLRGALLSSLRTTQTSPSSRCEGSRWRTRVGVRRTALTEGDDFVLAWAPDGQRMVFYRDPPCSRYSNAEAECPPKVLRSRKYGLIVRDRGGRTRVLTHSEAFGGDPFLVSERQMDHFCPCVREPGETG